MLFAGPAPAVEAALASLGPQMRWSAALFVSLAGVCAAIGMRFAEDTGGNEDEQRLIGVASRSDAPVGVALPVLQMVSNAERPPKKEHVTGQSSQARLPGELPSQACRFPAPPAAPCGGARPDDAKADGLTCACACRNFRTHPHARTNGRRQW